VEKMDGIIKEKVTGGEGTQVIYKCEEDSEVLWEELQSGVVIRGRDCGHYEWTPVGNGCYPQSFDKEICEGVKDIKEKAIKKIDEGLTIWFLVPRLQ
jgi:hypothetical protein